MGEDDAITGTFSVFSGPEPIIRGCSNSEDEMNALTSWLEDVSEHYPLNEICLVSRDFLGHQRIQRTLERKRVSWHIIRGRTGNTLENGGIRLTTLERIKGLEFSAVAIVGLGEVNQVPSRQSKDEEIRERNRLFVAMTRAKNELYN